MADNKMNGIAGKPELAGEDDQTVKIPKSQVQASKGPRVSLTSPGKDAVKPSDETSISPAQVGEGKTKGRKTIKLKPISGDIGGEENAEETISMPRADLDEEATNSMPPLNIAEKQQGKGNLEDESTVKIQKPKMSKPAHPIPDVTAQPMGSKQTVKLRPPSADKGSAKPAASASKKTIKLSTPAPKAKAPAPAPAPKTKAPAVKAPAPAPKPSAPTVKMENPKSKTSGKKGLQLKKSGTPAPPPASTQSSAGGAPPVGSRTTSGSSPVATDQGANPSTFFTIAAVLAALCMVYYVWAVAGQFFEQYQEVETTNVPGLSGAVLPPQ